MNQDQLVTGIEKQIKEFESKAEEYLKRARILESEANSLETYAVWNEAAQKYYEAGQQFRKASIHINFIQLWINRLNDDVLERLKLRKNGELYVQYKKKLKESHKKAADLFKKSSDIMGKIENKFYQADMLGLAASEYFRVFELSEDEELKIDVEPGKVYSFSETFVGNIVSLYRRAASLFNDLGIEFEESGKISRHTFFTVIWPTHT